jgi:hypothetical protein
MLFVGQTWMQFPHSVQVEEIAQAREGGAGILGEGFSKGLPQCLLNYCGNGFQWNSKVAQTA